MDTELLIQHETAPYVCDDTVTFFVQKPDATSIDVIGSFNKWTKASHPLRRRDDGWWVSDPIKVPAPARHLYRFLINGETFYDDPLNFNKTQNKHGPATCFDTWADIPGMGSQLEGIHTSLIHNLPGTGNPWVRDLCTSFLDDYLQQPNVNRSSTVRNFYVKRILNALEEIEGTDVREGIRLWHIYNHGYVFKTPKTVFGIDVVTARHIWNLAWDIPEEIPYRLAGLLDVLCVTHNHSDHADMELASRMLAIKKSVVVPEAVCGKFPRGVFAIEPNRPASIRGQSIIARPGTHVYDHGRNVHCVTYEITTDGDVTVYHTGDHDYAENLKWQEPPDVLIPKFDGVTPKMPNDKVLQTLFAYGDAGLIVPGHINELAHYPLGGRTSLRDAVRQFQTCKVPYQILLWGESYPYT